MKKLIFSILFILIFHIGCASLKPERNVVNNQFVSTYPKIKIQIIPELKYIEGISQSGYTKGIEAEKLTHSADSYAFVEAERTTSWVKRAIIIQFSRTGGAYIRNFYRNMEKTALEYGKLEIGGKEYRYFTTIGTPTDKGYLTKHIYEKGYKMSCGLIKFYGRLIGTNNILTQIIYYEDIKNSGLSCHSWKYKQSLTDSHLQYLEGYNKRFKSSFEIAGPKTTIEAAEPKTTSETVSPASAAYATTNKTFIEIKEPDQVREFGKPKYEVSPGDILEVIHTKTCRSGSGICWKVRNIKTGELGYVFAERMRKRHRVYKGDSNFEIAGPKTTSETVSPKTTSDSQLAGDGPQKLAPNVNQEEPWTGKWRVEGHNTLKGIWAMKQSGQIVKSTKDSYFKFEGIVRGNQLEGKLTGDYNLTHNFVITLSSDGQSFKGITKGQHAPSSGPIKGKRE